MIDSFDFETVRRVVVYQRAKTGSGDIALKLDELGAIRLAEGLRCEPVAEHIAATLAAALDVKVLVRIVPREPAVVRIPSWKRGDGWV